MYPLYRLCDEHSSVPALDNDQFQNNINSFVSKYDKLVKSSKMSINRSINVDRYIRKTFCSLITSDLFGSKRNLHCFQRFIGKIVNSCFTECVFIRFLTKGFQYSAIQWLSGISTISMKIHHLQKVKTFSNTESIPTDCLLNSHSQGMYSNCPLPI